MVDQKSKFSDIYEITFSDLDNGYNEFIKNLDMLNNKYNIEYTCIPNGFCSESLEQMVNRSNNFYGINIEKRAIIIKDQTDYKIILENHINKITKSCDKLVITDRYFFPKYYDDAYKTLLLSICSKCPHTTVIIDKNYNRKLVTELTKELLEKGCFLEVIINDTFHDRFFISNKGGVVLGTSLNGLIKKTCYINYLSHQDFLIVAKELNRIKIKI